VGLTTEDLLTVGRKSRAQSDADLIVANLYEDMSQSAHRAHVLDASGNVETVATKKALCAVLGEKLTTLLSRNSTSTTLA
jgi:hypothetical protein